MSYGDLPEVGQRLQPGQPDDAARRDHRRQPERGAGRRPRQAWTRSTSASRTPGTSTATGKTRPASVGRRDRARLRPRATPRAPGTRIEAVDESAKYSWVKSPRWNGHAMEVGPLARYVIGYAKGIPEFKEPVDMVLAKLGVPVTALFSTLGRTAARGLECSWAAHALEGGVQEAGRQHQGGRLDHGQQWRTSSPHTWPKTARAMASSRRRAARSATGSTSRTRRSRTTSASCRRPGTRARATRPARSAPTRRRCSTRRCTTRSSRSRSCGRSTASTRAWPARRTCCDMDGNEVTQRQGALRRDAMSNMYHPSTPVANRVREGKFSEAILPPPACSRGRSTSTTPRCASGTG